MKYEFETLETYYLVRTVATVAATEVMKESTETIITGKQDEVLYWDGHFYAIDRMTPSFVREYGYKRMGDAKRSYKYTHPENHGLISSTAEIITVTIHKVGDCPEWLA